MDVKIFYRLSPSVLEAIIYQVNDSVDILFKKDEPDYDLIAKLDEELRSVLIIYLQNNTMPDAMTAVMKRVLRREDMPEIKCNAYNYNRIELIRGWWQ